MMQVTINGALQLQAKMLGDSPIEWSGPDSDRDKEAEGLTTERKEEGIQLSVDYNSETPTFSFLIPISSGGT